MKTQKPHPVVIKTICSLCGLDWDGHGDDPTAEDCVRLLKAEVAKKSTPITYWTYWPNVYTPTYIQPYTSVTSAGSTWTATAPSIGHEQAQAINVISSVTTA